jgi:chromate reductase, NAD(P)H dehydrogenase (quinone)
MKVALAYQALIKEQGVNAQILDFCALPRDLAFTDTFGSRSEAFAAIMSRYITNIRKFIFIVPEYNGSFPGLLKVFLDSTQPRDWHDKDACLVGISDGRAGNLRGLDHLTGILNYLKIHVYHDKLPISVINTVLNDSGEIVSGTQLKACVAQVEGFLRF